MSVDVPDSHCDSDVLMSVLRGADSLLLGADSVLRGTDSLLLGADSSKSLLART